MEKRMTVGVRCVVCKEWKSISMRLESYLQWMARKTSDNPKPIQNIFPYLTDGERELLVSRICDVCWNNTFPEELIDDTHTHTQG